jgi:hypothetical protein
VQLATAKFMREGHYMRHLRHTKRLYSAQRDALPKCLRPRAKDSVVGGLAVVLRLPDGAPDVSIAKEALAALTHHPHAHIIVSGGGISPDGERWISSENLHRGAIIAFRRRRWPSRARLRWRR